MTTANLAVRSRYLCATNQEHRSESEYLTLSLWGAGSCPLRLPGEPKAFDTDPSGWLVKLLHNSERGNALDRYLADWAGRPSEVRCARFHDGHLGVHLKPQVWGTPDFDAIVDTLSAARAQGLCYFGALQVTRIFVDNETYWGNLAGTEARDEPPL